MKLEQMADYPLKLFDDINNDLWENPNDAEVARYIAEARAKIKAEPDEHIRHNMVVGYMIVVTELYGRNRSPDIAVKAALNTIDALREIENAVIN